MKTRPKDKQSVSHMDDVHQFVGKSKQILEITKLPGDASTRQYFRITTVAGTTMILMKMESFDELGTDLPFLLVQSHLKQAGVDVPQVLDADPARGFILLEDLGDVTLLKKLQTVSSPETERHLYEKIIDELVSLQVRASPGPNPLKFDFEKLMWEVHFTIKQFYELYLKRTISDQDRQIMETGFGSICAYLAGQPTVMAHRDFHSRNVMVTPSADGKSERYVMIDFQDARLGPAQYDLASLLKDSYYQLEEAQIERLLDYYVARYEAEGRKSLDRVEFKKVFDWMAVQRNFKAIGSFASFVNKRSDPTYLKYIGNTFENIRRTLLKYPEFSNLREVLFHHYYF